MTPVTLTRKIKQCKNKIKIYGKDPVPDPDTNPDGSASKLKV
jgi:hypothetical protein